MIRKVKIAGEYYSLKLEGGGENWKCDLDVREIVIQAKLIEPNVLFLVIDGKTYDIKRDSPANQSRIWIENQPIIVEVFDPRSFKRAGGKTSTAGSTLLASMPGKVLRVLVAEMQAVEAGQSLMVVEAMKMQNEIKSPGKGTVRQLVAEGTRVNAGDVLAVVE